MYSVMAVTCRNIITEGERKRKISKGGELRMKSPKRRLIASVLAVLLSLGIKELPLIEGVGKYEYTLLFMLVFLCVNELLKE